MQAGQVTMHSMHAADGERHRMVALSRLHFLTIVLLPPSPTCSAWPSRWARSTSVQSGRRRRWRRCLRCSAPAAGWMGRAVWSWREERRSEQRLRQKRRWSDRTQTRQGQKDQTWRDHLMMTRPLTPGGQTGIAQPQRPGGHGPRGQPGAQEHFAHSGCHVHGVSTAL